MDTLARESLGKSKQKQSEKDEDDDYGDDFDDDKDQEAKPTARPTLMNEKPKPISKFQELVFKTLYIQRIVFIKFYIATSIDSSKSKPEIFKKKTTK